MLDMIRPRHVNQIRLMDLKRCELPGIFYDTFFNLEKYLEQEQKDPFARLHVCTIFDNLFNNLLLLLT